MSPRHLPGRIITAAAIIAATVGFGMQAAHASALTTVSAEHDCMPQNPGHPLATWHAHIAVAANAPNHVLFVVQVDGGIASPFDLAPGVSMTIQRGGNDGTPSHLVVSADGQVVLDKTETLLCNPPVATIDFHCNYGGPTGKEAALWFQFKNWSSVKLVFVAHLADGKTYTYANGGELGFSDYLKEDKPYKTWITINGQIAATKSGTTDCVANAPKPKTTTTSTTVASVTTISVPSSGTIDPPAGTPGTPGSAKQATTVAAFPAKPGTTSATLPYTGGTSAPLGAIGFALIGLGGAALLLVRRRATEA